ncbi:hypothetical protein GCM10010466_45550 [Planomonospora alba]|uniref:Uncharacterized protein n=1 Tax=Planomonospora alba TaxID=161354 RepID=A0ABP6NKM4_9ACTN
MPVAGVTEDLQELQLLARLQALLAQLHDVDPAGEGGVEEVGEVPPVAAAVGAQVEAGVRKRGSGHAA